MKTFKNWVVTEAKETAGGSVAKLRNALVRALVARGVKAEISSMGGHASEPLGKNIQLLDAWAKVQSGKEKETKQLIVKVLTDDLGLQRSTSAPLVMGSRDACMYKANDGRWIEFRPASAATDFQAFFKVLGPRKK